MVVRNISRVIMRAENQLVLGRTVHTQNIMSKIVRKGSHIISWKLLEGIAELLTVTSVDE